MSTLQHRINKILTAEGPKVHGKSTHIFRASCITALTSEGMDLQKAKLIVGHAAIGGATERYLKRSELLRLIQPRDRRHLSSLPHPDVVRKQALAALDRQSVRQE